MQESNFSFMLLQFKDKVPNDALLPLKESLEKANEAAMEMLVFANLKNPLLALVLSLLLPGADRRYSFGACENRLSHRHLCERWRDNKRGHCRKFELCGDYAVVCVLFLGVCVGCG